MSSGTALPGEPMATATVNGEPVPDGEEYELLAGIIPAVTFVQDGDDVEVTITQGGQVDESLYMIEESKNGYWIFYPIDYDNPDTKYNSFTINGGTLTGDDRFVIENGTDPYTDLPFDAALVSIVNVSEKIEVSNLVFRGGSWSYAGADETEVPPIGIGLNIGRSNEPGPNDVAPKAIVVRDVLADKNVYDVENDFTTVASGTGINVAGMSSDSDVVSDVLYERVDLTGNHMTLTATGTGAGAVAPVLRGGGSRVNSAKSFAYTGGVVDGNRVTLDSEKGWAAGGGLSVDGDGGQYDVFDSVRLDGVTFTNNAVIRRGDSVDDSVGRGGAFYFGGYNSAGSTLSIFNSTFTDNNVTATGTNNSALGGGASIIMGNVTTTISDTAFTGNSVVSENGGGHAFGGALSARAEVDAFSQSDNALAIAASTFTDNRAVAATTARGGAVELAGGRGHGITDTTFSGNSAEGTDEATGGALYFAALAGSDNAIVDSTFSGNSVTSSGVARGGAVYHASGNLLIQGDGQNSHRDNKAVADAGGTAVGGAIASESVDDLVIKTELFENNRAVADAATGTASGAASTNAAATSSSLTAPSGTT
ncbi:MAG: hypothetical protein LIQ31_12850 [Planctomycetes bacterium]|nr:hypothetical protein [Planctomycetota bacterium]